MIIRQIAAMALMVFGAVCAWSAADAGGGSAETLLVQNVKFQQRYPWNGKVDISFDVKGQDLVKIGVTVFTNGVLMGEAKTIEGDLELSLGEDLVETNGVHLVWDAAKDLPAGFKSDKVKVKVAAEQIVSTYQVKYLELGTKAELATTKVVKGAHVDRTVTEQAEAVDYYSLVDTETKDLKIARDSAENTITFYYQRTMTSYTVRYMDKNNPDKELATAKTVKGVPAGSTVSCQSIGIEDYEVDGAATQQLQVKSDAAENVVTFYYVRVYSSYTVRYTNCATGLPAATEDVVTGCKVGSVVTVRAKEIEGFTASVTSYRSTIEADPEKNIIIFMYDENQVP